MNNWASGYLYDQKRWFLINQEISLISQKSDFGGVAQCLKS